MKVRVVPFNTTNIRGYFEFDFVYNGTACTVANVDTTHFSSSNPVTIYTKNKSMFIELPNFQKSVFIEGLTGTSFKAYNKPTQTSVDSPTTTTTVIS